MKKLIIILGLIFLMSLNGYSQWLSQTSPTTRSLKKIFVVNTTTAYIAGDYQVILKTTNSGAQWTKLKENANGYTLYDAIFYNENTGIFVGGGYWGNKTTYQGLIFRTPNGGLSWDSIVVNNICFLKVAFIDPMNGFAGGWSAAGTSPLFKTTDYGQNWSQVSNLPCLSNVMALTFINANTGWAAGDSTSLIQGVIKTTNGGASWFTCKNFGSSMNSQIYSIKFVDANTGWLVGVESSPSWVGLIMKTTDGGFTWTQQTNHCFNEIYDVWFADANTGWVTSDGPQLQKTTNGGINWNVQTISSTSFLNSVQFVDANTGWCVGEMGQIFYTNNGGGTISVRNISTEIPDAYTLNQNYPNPFNPSTKIRYSIPKNSLVRLTIFDALGREVQTLVNQSQVAGTYEATFEAGNYPSGIYFYKLSAGDFSDVRKMILVK